MGKKRETTAGLSSSRDGGTPSGVPEVQGTDPATTVPDISGVSGLPGVRSGHSDGEPKKVSKIIQSVGTRSIKDIEQMSLDEKISVLNAFRKIRNRPPKVSDESIREMITVLYLAWVDEMMEKILAPPKTSLSLSGFTVEETQAIKVLAQTILQRQTQVPQPVAVAPSKPVMFNPGSAKPMGNKSIPSGLNPGVDTDAFQKAQKELLLQLSKMEREGPEF
jgi:hypothetical protein